MNKIFLIILSFLIFTSVSAQQLVGVRIYINPGHGGLDSDDRNVQATGFWESVSNLDKGLYLRDILLDLNAEIRMSRTTNNTGDDLPLSVISADANNFDADYFHAIHSNALNGQINYPLMLFRGYDEAPVFPEAKEMAAILWQKILVANRGVWVHSWQNIRGDWSFYPQWGDKVGLGVLRNLLMPGVLSEGSFHDYIPESFRLRNTLYKKHEAWALARSFLEYFEVGGFADGIVAGIVRSNIFQVDYFSIASSGDRRLPLNNVKVELQPVNLTYEGDNFNNGFYMFDNLQPGEYSVIISADDYASDTLQISVQANKTTFADRNLALAQLNDLPKILTSVPAQDAGKVRLSEKIKIDFNVLMNTQSVEAAFSISPPVFGEFSWENNFKTMIFSPSANFLPGSQYIVKIDSGAMSYFNVPLGEDFVFSFNTRSELNLILSYPSDEETGVSTTVQVQLWFDAPIDQGSLFGNISFENANGDFIPPNVDQTAYGLGKIIFEPSGALLRNSIYRVVLNEGLTDKEGLQLNTNFQMSFRTENSSFSGGNIVDDFENLSVWLEPELNQETTGIDEVNTNFEKASYRKYSGSHSGVLEYKFTGDSGVVVLEHTAPPLIGSAGRGDFGIWLFGDISGNIIEYWLTNENGLISKLAVDTINWTGWKLRGFNLGDLSLEGDLFLKSLVLKQSETGLTEGRIFFDDATYDYITPVKNENELLPSEFALKQNYPNPFNPSTIIKFSLPVETKVGLHVFNIIGQKIATLIDGNFYAAGNWEINWEGVNDAGKNVPSGVYFYRLTSQKFQGTKKMILLR